MKDHEQVLTLDLADALGEGAVEAVSRPLRAESTPELEFEGSSWLPRKGVSDLVRGENRAATRLTVVLEPRS